VRYEAVNAMLLNEFLKEHQKVEEQEQKLQKQEATIVRHDQIRIHLLNLLGDEAELRDLLGV
jgi:hypothetical protein